jgi:phosphoserine phosphatase RsbU/P
MLANKIILIESPASSSHRELVDQTLKIWPADDRPKIVYASLDKVVDEPGCLEDASLAWLLLNDPSAKHAVYAVVGLLQDQHIPALLTRCDETLALGATFQDGVTITPPSTPAAAIVGMARALLSQADTIRALKAEIEILRLHQGGLCDQMDKLDEELRLAAQLQREFLPEKLPSVGNVHFTVLYRPAGYVSGDIYDVIRLDERHVGFFLADAVGHGVPAALMTVFIKRSLHTKRYDADLPAGYAIVTPDETMRRLNQDMVRQQSGKVRFATACYGIIDTQSMQVSIARAGHPFPLVVRADGSSEWLNPEGGLLGVFPDEEYALARTTLDPGDRLLLYSDGFELAFPQVEVEGRDIKALMHAAYSDAFKNLAHLPPAKALQDLASRIDQQAGSLHQLDDLTALLIAAGEEPKADEPRETLAATVR